MRRNLAVPLLILGVLLLTVTLFTFFRRANAGFGEALALCPGPDLYGYTCEGGTAFAYIDATNDTRLYEDDGVTRIDLPFPFTFYGTTYNTLYASSNGNLQFGSNPSAQYTNRCIANSVDPQLGDMIAPFWDDLDLTSFGYLETETVGTAPERIFVIEWDDIPVFGDPEDRVTFAVQLFESSSHIVFLYNDVTLLNGNNGASATIGVQSAAQELALQYGCNQPVVANASQIRFLHPEPANADVQGVETAVVAPTTEPLLAKGVVAELMNSLSIAGRRALPELNMQWQQDAPPRTAVWEWLDLHGGGEESLLVIWRSTIAFPEQTRLALLHPDGDDAYRLLLDIQISRRDAPIPRLDPLEQGDVTGDGQTDLLLYAPDTGHGFVLSAHEGEAALYTLPLLCHDRLGIAAGGIVGAGCAGEDGRVTFAWSNNTFQTAP